MECRELNWAALNLSLAQSSQKCRPAHCHLLAKPVLVFLVQISITDAKKMSPRSDPVRQCSLRPDAVILGCLNLESISVETTKAFR